MMAKTKLTNPTSTNFCQSLILRRRLFIAFDPVEFCSVQDLRAAGKGGGVDLSNLLAIAYGRIQQARTISSKQGHVARAQKWWSRPGLSNAERWPTAV